MTKTFLVLSDIHACDIDPASANAPSYVSSFNPDATARIDPLADLQRLLKAEGKQPNFIMCAGDITNRSQPSSFTYAWNKLQTLAAELQAELIATVGNHDLDSRFKANGFDPKGYAMSLTPSLPVANRLPFLEFWAENFTLLQFDSCNILVLNTAAYHGGGKDAETEIEHGRISDVTIAAIERTISAAPVQSTNILLCHHHPIKGDQGDHELVGQTRGGEKLINLLNQQSSPWIVVHGHKHVPDLFYGHGGANAPVILGSASFSAQVNADAQNKNPNQVHLLTVDPVGASLAGLMSAGCVNSWTWEPGVGWERAQGNQGLPFETGFGYRASPAALANNIAQHLTSVGQSQISWQDAIAFEPSLVRLIPNDFALFRQSLTALNLTILSDDGLWAQIGRRA
jgi:predicted phosphodiesterase